MQTFNLKRNAVVSGQILNTSETHHEILVDSVQGGIKRADWKKGDKVFIPISEIKIPAE